MSVLVTGAAGFIGYHTCEALLARGLAVTGLDCLNDYYDVRLKGARLSRLVQHDGFRFLRQDFSDHAAMLALKDEDFTHIIHLGAQPGVRYSLINPYAYITANVMGHVVMLELARRLKNLTNFVYASSSSVYGGNTKLPFAVGDAVETPQSLYAATKRADELMSYTYAHLFRIPTTGLRFFTVYGPWGRPDMAAYIFTRRILAGQAIKVFNHGKMRRDFTFIGDVVAGVLAALDRPPQDKGAEPPAALYNLGNSHAEDLMRFVSVLETALGKKAVVEFAPMQPGDVRSTFADISDLARDVGYAPSTSAEEGLKKFVKWFREYYGY